MNGAPVSRRRLPSAIWALGFVSLLMDVSSERIHSLLPVFMATVLGASMVTIGLIEGAAEATPGCSPWGWGCSSPPMRCSRSTASVPFSGTACY